MKPWRAYETFSKLLENSWMAVYTTGFFIHCSLNETLLASNVEFICIRAIINQYVIRPGARQSHKASSVSKDHNLNVLQLGFEFHSLSYCLPKHWCIAHILLCSLLALERSHTPWVCMYSTVFVMVYSTALASRSEKNFCLRILSSSSPPFSSSVTRYTERPSSYTCIQWHSYISRSSLISLNSTSLLFYY